MAISACGVLWVGALWLWWLESWWTREKAVMWGGEYRSLYSHEGIF
jgi:hypothetical protein